MIDLASNRGWGPKMCCRCSRPGHHAHECKQPIYPTAPPAQPEEDKPKPNNLDEDWEETGMWGYI